MPINGDIKLYNLSVKLVKFHEQVITLKRNVAIGI